MPLPRPVHNSGAPLLFRCRVSPSLFRPRLPSYNLRISSEFVTKAPTNPAHAPSVVDRRSLEVYRRSLKPIMGSHSQHRHHGGHSHSHTHDNTYLTSTNKKDAGVRITRIGLYVNCLMALGKAMGGYFFNSQSLLADAFHSLTDLVSDILTLSTVAWSLKSPTERFPSGYGKIESLGSLGVSSLLLAGGMGLGWHSCEILYNMWFPVEILGSIGDHAGHGHDHAHGHAHGGGGIFSHSHSHNPADMGIPNIHAAWIAGGSIIVKEYLYRATIKIAKERKSSVLASNAVHHRIDSLTSIVALTAILGSNIFSNISWLDPVGGLLVSIMVIRAGWGNTGNALLEIADVSIDEEVKHNVGRAAKEALTANPINDAVSGQGTPHRENFTIGQVSGIKAGQSYLVEVDVKVPEDVTIKETRPIEKLVRERVGANVRGVRRVKVSFHAATESPNFVDDFVGPMKSSVGGQISKEAHNHHTHTHSE